MTAPLIPMRECWTYWGGCDPTGVDAVLRGVAALVGFGPSESSVGMALLFLALSPAVSVLYVDPLPETGRGVAERVVMGLVAVPVIGHGRRVLVDVFLALGVSPLWLIAAVVVAIVGAVVLLGVLRLWLLVANLRGESA